MFRKGRISHDNPDYYFVDVIGVLNLGSRSKPRYGSAARSRAGAADIHSDNRRGAASSSYSYYADSAADHHWPADAHHNQGSGGFADYDTSTDARHQPAKRNVDSPWADRSAGCSAEQSERCDLRPGER